MAKRAVNIVVGLFVAAMMAAFLIPIAMGAMTSPDVTSIQQNTTETVNIQDDMNVTLDSVDTASSPSTGTYTVQAGGDSATATVGVDENATVTVNGADVTLSPDSVSSGSATTQVESPTTYGWGGAASSLWFILPLLIVLAVFLYIVGMAVGRF